MILRMINQHNANLYHNAIHNQTRTNHGLSFQLNFSADDVFTNILLVSRFRYSKELERFGKPNDLKRWIMNPGTVNAFYTRTGKNRC